MTAKRDRGQAGFTLVELLVAMPIALIVVFAAMTLVASAERSERAGRERTEALADQRNSLERMTRELRHATVFTFLTSQVVEFDGFVYSGGAVTLRRIRFDCSSGSGCTRQEGPPGGPVGVQSTPLIDALENPDVFEPSPELRQPALRGHRRPRALRRRPSADHPARRRRSPQPHPTVLAMRALIAISRRLRSEQGFGVVEVVVAAAVLLMIAGATLATLTEAEQSSSAAEQHEAAVSLAQREVEKLRQNGWSGLGLVNTPTGTAASPDPNPDDPREYVSGGNYLVKANWRRRSSGPPPGVSGTGEPFVVLPGGASPGPTRVTSGGHSFDVYRYVTWVNITCVVAGVDQCNGVNDGKRIVVAVRPLADGDRVGMRKPAWVASVLTDPNAVAAGLTPPPPPAGSTQTAQPFFLYDTPCDQTSRQAIAGSHSAHDTLTGDACPAAGARPDLMWKVAPAATTPAPALYDYSTNFPVARTTAMGKGLRPPAGGSNDCTVSRATAAASQHTMHRWVSNKMTANFISGQRSALNLATKTVNEVEGEATLCVALHKMSTTNVVNPVALATGSHRIAAPSWPTTPTEVGFAFNHPAATPTFTIATNERLVLVVWLTGNSLADGIELLFDHQDADSLLSVTTTTPLP